VVELRKINRMEHLVRVQGLLGIFRRKSDFVSFRLRWEHNSKFLLQLELGARTGFTWLRKGTSSFMRHTLQCSLISIKYSECVT
jgi:hypothetical protein